MGREFTPMVYRAVAEERWTSLRVLYENEMYPLVLYVAGVAVESIFRAYRCRIDPVFDSRHDLYDLAKAARFDSIVPSEERRRYGAALDSIARRWSNSHRYRSESAMRSYLKRLKLDRRISGDFVKENARQAALACGFIVSIGVRQWTI
jgi:hypothetical protein